MEMGTSDGKMEGNTEASSKRTKSTEMDFSGGEMAECMMESGKLDGSMEKGTIKSLIGSKADSVNGDEERESDGLTND